VAPGGRAQIIEYEIVSWSDLAQMGHLSTLVSQAMGAVARVGILRCVIENDTKVTFVGDAGATSKLVRMDGAGAQPGVRISKKDFPVMLEGWPHRFE
jgi:hypothetical protein